MQYLDRFGAQAVFGTQAAPVNLLRRMATAEKAVASYNAYRASQNGAEWARSNPVEFRLIAEALESIHGRDG